MPEEVWKPVPGFPMYEASDRGRVRSLHGATPRYLRGFASGSGARYRRVWLDGTPTYLHRIVALTFIGEPPFDRAVVRHLDDDPANNAVSNLAYGSKSDNGIDAVRNGRCANTEKEACKNGHAFTPENTELARSSRNGRPTRVCRTCRRTKAVA